MSTDGISQNRQWTAVECLPAKPGRWCVVEGPQVLAEGGYPVGPMRFVTDWCLSEEIARRIADEHNVVSALRDEWREIERLAREVSWDEGHDEARHGTPIENNPYRKGES